MGLKIYKSVRTVCMYVPKLLKYSSHLSRALRVKWNLRTLPSMHYLITPQTITSCLTPMKCLEAGKSVVMMEEAVKYPESPTGSKVGTDKPKRYPQIDHQIKVGDHFG